MWTSKPVLHSELQMDQEQSPSLKTTTLVGDGTRLRSQHSEGRGSWIPWVRGQPGLQTYFQNSQRYTEKPSFKKQNNNNKKPITKTVYWFNQLFCSAFGSETTLFLIFLLFCLKWTLCSRDCPWTLYINQASLNSPHLPPDPWD